MEQVKEFEAHSYGVVTSLAVHPTRPFVLSFSYLWSLKLWDWNNDWSCVGVFDIKSPVKQVMFNLKHTNTFATHDDTVVKVCLNSLVNLFPTSLAHLLCSSNIMENLTSS